MKMPQPIPTIMSKNLFSFRVWAPHAKAVSVIGEFNGWDEARGVMTKINELTDGNGFDIVYEVSGSKPGVLLTTKACKIRGTIVSMGLSGLEYPFPIGQISFKEQTLVGSRTYSEPNFIGGVRMLEKLDKQYDLSKLISDELTIDEAQKAIDMMINKTNNGKILIKCN